MIEFALYHCIVDDDPAQNEEALATFGRAIASWSRFEHHLDALLVHVNKEHRSPKIFEPHPVSFTKKLDLLKRWFNQYPPLSEFSDDIRTLTSKIRPIAATDRNLFSHSILAGYTPETQCFLFHSLQVKEENVVSRHVEYTTTQMVAFFEVVQICNAFLSHMTTQLFTSEWTERLEKP